VIEGETPGTVGEGDTLADQPEAAGSKKQLTGRVVGVIKRNWRPYCGIILPSTNAKVRMQPSTTVRHTAQAQRVLFSPEDKKVPYVKIQTRQLDTLMDHRIVVAIDSWPVDSRYPLVRTSPMRDCLLFL
jgi:exosome complex exonuclease DIS3/RRP44